jgi:integrase
VTALAVFGKRRKLLGHKSITTTADIYTDWDIDQLEETMRLVNEEGGL